MNALPGLVRKTVSYGVAAALIAALVVPVAVNAAREDASPVRAKTARVASASGGQSVGSPVQIRGRVSTVARTGLEIRFSPRGSRAWRPLKRVRTNRNGAFLTAVKARRHGMVLALPAGGRPSSPVPVRVRSRTAAKLKSSDVETGERANVIARARPGGRRPYRVVVKGADERVIEGVTRPNGRFRAGWTVNGSGTHRVKVHVGANRAAFGSSSKRRKLTALRPAGASWYGPGFYGGTTACGHTLSSSTVGVAHKTLPCGTELTIRYGGRTVKAPVIDRGPYVAGREIDLTYATKEKLGFGDVGTVLIDG